MTETEIAEIDITETCEMCGSPMRKAEVPPASVAKIQKDFGVGICDIECFECTKCHGMVITLVDPWQ